ncbi:MULTISPECIES: AraC family transcriptional regulator [Caballeronia]|uniref:AraC family transcriptional regulator n=1 Tax=Caballeronia zhejiangensis TaxID=871203 RepID=A0A656QSF8_9BURK|nr:MULTISPECIES: AraC family transcriptional regulator [Caballeronia]EKS71166.1 AraC family transcriptional regulator [Burkholderia sp. SJ98]KDR34186.1 AraC family transcriptional regulator [Caballeronia zhejiangensis]MDR5788391.1 AraC family transcriptional regulator [Caballeronia sp. LP003]
MSQANLVDALAYIESNFDKTVSLAQLADLSALSVSRFATVFREQFGLSPYKYLCELRVRRAQTLLLAGVPGSVVATEVGFFDQSHLARHFKRLCGMTPSAFVERARRKARSAELDAGLGKRVTQAQPRVFAFDGAHVA